MFACGLLLSIISSTDFRIRLFTSINNSSSPLIQLTHIFNKAQRLVGPPIVPRKMYLERLIGDRSRFVMLKPEKTRRFSSAVGIIAILHAIRPFFFTEKSFQKFRREFASHDVADTVEKPVVPFGEPEIVEPPARFLASLSIKLSVKPPAGPSADPPANPPVKPPADPLAKPPANFPTNDPLAKPSNDPLVQPPDHPSDPP